MECYVTSATHQRLSYLQNYYSLIWTERYSAFGDFQLRVPTDSQYRHALRPGNHLSMVGSPYTMMIEDVQVKKNTSENHLEVSGRSLEAVLERRTIMLDINKPPSTLRLIFAHVGAEFMGTSGGGTLYPPSKIVPGFTMDSTIPGGVEERPVWDYIFQKETVYTAVKALCDDHNLGFKVTLNNSTGGLRFSIYKGVDRSSKTSGNPAIFSLEMQNLKSLAYLYTNRAEATVAIVDLGPDAWSMPEIRVWLTPSEPTGLARKEIRVDGAELARRWDNGSSPVLANNLAIAARLLGMIELRASQEKLVLDAEIENGKPPMYRSGYNLGDIVLMYNSVDVQTKYRVTEYIRSYSPQGNKEYPTFEAVYK